MLQRILWMVFAIPALAGQLFAEPPRREPVAVAYLSSLDQVLEDVDYITTTGGQPELSQMIRGFITNLNHLEGIDRTQPMGVFAFFPSDLKNRKKDPDLVGFIPVTNIEALQKTAHLSNILSLQATDKPNRYEFKTPEKTLSVLIDQGHAFITEKAELLEQPLPVPASLTDTLGKQYDLVIQVRKAGVPKPLWDLVLFGALSASDKPLREFRKSRAAEDVAKVRGIEMGRRVVTSLMTEARSAWLGLRVSRESRNAVIDAKLEFAESGAVSRVLAQMAGSPSALAKSAAADVSAGLHLHIALPEEAQRLSTEGFRIAREKKDPTESIPEPQRTSVNALLDVLQKTVDAGEYDFLLQFTGEPQTGMTAILGVHVADGQTLAEAVMKLLPEAKHSDKVSAVSIDAGQSRGIHFARIDGIADQTANADKTDELFYGGRPSLYIGTEASTLWLLVGDKDAIDDFGSLADEPQRAADRTTAAAFGQAHVHLSDWIGLLSLAKDQKTRDFTAAARIAVKDPDRDALHFVLRPETDGLRMTLTLDEAFLNLIGAAIGKK